MLQLWAVNLVKEIGGLVPVRASFAPAVAKWVCTGRNEELVRNLVIEYFFKPVELSTPKIACLNLCCKLVEF